MPAEGHQSIDGICLRRRKGYPLSAGRVIDMSAANARAVGLDTAARIVTADPFQLITKANDKVDAVRCRTTVC
jgi:hypothetical protein